MTDYKHSTRWAETALRYLDALDVGDVNVLAELWEQAEVNPELEHMLGELTDGLAIEEGPAAAWETDAARVRNLLAEHLPSASLPDADPLPLTVADVAARLQADSALGGRLSAADREVNSRLRSDATQIPGELGLPNFEKWQTTLGVRATAEGATIMRGDNRDKSGINGDFLCIKGRYAFDFANSPERITKPLLRHGGKLVPVSWEQAIDHIAQRFRQVRDSQGGEAMGVIGSNRTTNEENYLLSRFTRTVLGTNNLDHHRTADFSSLVGALTEASATDRYATMQDVSAASSILLIGNNPTQQHPLIAYQIRQAVRQHAARLYIINSSEIKLRRQASLDGVRRLRLSGDGGECEGGGQQSEGGHAHPRNVAERRASGDSDRVSARRRKRELRKSSRRGDAADVIAVDIGEPQGSVRTDAIT